jgi:exonuclease III
MMIALTIYLELLSQGVERQPGPPKNKSNMAIVTYNCNGLGDPKKLKRLLIKCNEMVNKGSIIFLQETHIVDTGYLETIWKHKFVSNCIATNSAGVIILFNKQYDQVYKHTDMEGRQLLVVIHSEEKKFILANAYFPNDHKQGITFAENIYTRILEAQANYPEYVTLYAGDWNVCLAPEDSINRAGSQSELVLSNIIKHNNEIAELSDAYRSVHAEKGFTWKRGVKYSRLDYIFVSNCATNNISGATTDWAFEASDHAAVRVELTSKEEIEKGPGIVKVNIKILEDPVVSTQIGKEIEEMMNQCDESWNPHLTLEFLKVSIRTVFSSKVSGIRQNINLEIKETEEELHQFEELKIKVISNENLCQEEKDNNTDTIERANLSLKTKLTNLRKKFSDTLTFVSKAKWFEYGEKSNKFFLNLNKCRQDRKLISKIRNNEKEFVGQKQISKGITDFYSELYSSQKREKCNEEDNFYDNCPKMSEEQSKFLDSELTLNELQVALSTCKDSSPGPDGIPYVVYKKYWRHMGPIILNAWKYSLKTGNLPPSHLESVITLLPKEGKDTKDIKNWRPITLSNCDSKIITKAISLKTSKVLESIIDPSQTAYVPGRSVVDNLRSNFFYKNQCSKMNIDAVLISLDAKKAFDSVDHKYIEETLYAYGFGPVFIQMFRTLYRNITARILINGFFSDSIKIERGVKQGDALSCAIFIICIDPLLRNINMNKKIKEIKITSKHGKKEDINFKGAAYADDISVICKKNMESIQQVFHEYERLTKRSGLELNADKTEILILNDKDKESICFNYNNESFVIQTVGKIKICGLFYCSNEDEEYQLNVDEKIKKLRYKIKLWSHRHLTMEGKILIVKTFGLSQIIYNMQTYGFKNEELICTERSIFKFLWSTKDNPNGIDRIKRTIMKNDYSNGGMKATDLESLDRSLKLKQFIRAFNSNHPISMIQDLLTKQSVQKKIIYQEYSNVTEEEAICKSAQETLNIIIDHNREKYQAISQDEVETDKNLIDEVSAINMLSYLKRKNKVFMICLLSPLTKNGIITLGELIQAYEYESDKKMLTTMKIIISTFPKHLVNIAKCYNEDINSDNQEMKFMQVSPGSRQSLNTITVKGLQVILKTALNKIDVLDVKKKLGVEFFDENNIVKFRNNCKNPKLRNIYFRLIHNDFFTRVRMKKFKMVDTDSCLRCNMTETTRHLLWECNQVSRIWRLFNDLMTTTKNSHSCVNKYEDVFQTPDAYAVCMIKIKVVQALIQIERPVNWNREKLLVIIEDLVNVERFNASISRNLEKFNTKWKQFVNLT